jgi:hypothetical protein
VVHVCGDTILPQPGPVVGGREGAKSVTFMRPREGGRVHIHQLDIGRHGRQSLAGPTSRMPVTTGEQDVGSADLRFSNVSDQGSRKGLEIVQATNSPPLNMSEH